MLHVKTIKKDDLVYWAIVTEYGQIVSKLFDSKKNALNALNRRLRHQVYTDLGLKKVRGKLGGVYYE